MDGASAPTAARQAVHTTMQEDSLESAVARTNDCTEGSTAIVSAEGTTSGEESCGEVVGCKRPAERTRDRVKAEGTDDEEDEGKRPRTDASVQESSTDDESEEAECLEDILPVDWWAMDAGAWKAVEAEFVTFLKAHPQEADIEISTTTGEVRHMSATNSCAAAPCNDSAPLTDSTSPAASLPQPSAPSAPVAASEANGDRGPDDERAGEDQEYWHHVLLAVIYTNAPVSVVSAILSASPASAKATDERGATALHVAIECEATMEVIFAFLSAWTGACLVQDTDGRTPLHLASAIGSMAFVKTLLGAGVTATETKDKDGRLPLHTAVATAAPTKVVKALLAAAPDTVKPLTNAGNTALRLALIAAQRSNDLGNAEALLSTWPECALAGKTSAIHSAISLGRLDMVQLVLKYCPAAAQQKGKNDKGAAVWPLHREEVMNDPQLFSAILRAYPAAADYKTKRWPSMLHNLCNKPHMTAVVPELITAVPETVRMKTARGSLPLHLAAKRQGTPYDTIASLIAAWPQSVREKDNHGWLPLHCACDAGASHEVLELLLSLYPEATSEDTNSGKLPLHLLCSSADVSSDAMVTLLAYDGDASEYVIDTTSETVLHVLCSNKNATAGALTALIGAYPAAAKMTAGGGYLPLHDLCEHKPSVEVLSTLLAANPAAARTRVSDGDGDPSAVGDDDFMIGPLPLHLAARYGASPAVLARLLSAYPGAISRLATADYSSSAAGVPDNDREEQRILPLHAMCANPAAEADAMKVLIAAYPQAVETPEGDLGLLPLHTAAECGLNKECILLLARAFPGAISKVTKSGSTPGSTALALAIKGGKNCACTVEALLSVGADIAAEKTDVVKLAKELKSPELTRTFAAHAVWSLDGPRARGWLAMARSRLRKAEADAEAEAARAGPQLQEKS